MATRRWERICALGEGGESAEPGGGSARPSHVWSPLTSWQEILRCRWQQPELNWRLRSEREEEQKNRMKKFGEEQDPMCLLCDSAAARRALSPPHLSLQLSLPHSHVPSRKGLVSRFGVAG